PDPGAGRAIDGSLLGGLLDGLREQGSEHVEPHLSGADERGRITAAGDPDREARLDGLGKDLEVDLVADTVAHGDGAAFPEALHLVQELEHRLPLAMKHARLR